MGLSIMKMCISGDGHHSVHGWLVFGGTMGLLLGGGGCMIGGSMGAAWLGATIWVSLEGCP